MNYLEEVVSGLGPRTRQVFKQEFFPLAERIRQQLMDCATQQEVSAQVEQLKEPYIRLLVAALQDHDGVHEERTSYATSLFRSLMKDDIHFKKIQGILNIAYTKGERNNLVITDAWNNVVKEMVEVTKDSPES